jgi:hypothetical protein
VTTHIQIQIEGKVLEPGQYVMKLLDSADRHVVQIYNFDTAALEMTVLAMPAYPLDPTGDTRLTFDEMPDGKTPALRTWFYQETTRASSLPQFARTHRLSQLPRLYQWGATAVCDVSTHDFGPRVLLAR